MVSILSSINHFSCASARKSVPYLGTAKLKDAKSNPSSFENFIVSFAIANVSSGNHNINVHSKFIQASLAVLIQLFIISKVYHLP
jgi:hypothetical protein